MMSMTRVIRYVAALAVVLAISAQAAQAGAPDHFTWKGQNAPRLGPQVGPLRGPMVATPTPRNELVLGGTVHQPTTVVRVAHSSGGSGFDWTAAFVGAASALGIIFVAGAATSVRHRRRVAIS
jgi:hypothetical protein